MLVIEIADRGPGFSPEMLENFGQPYRSTKGRPGGGLGLFLLVNVLRKLGGGASVANRDAGGALGRIFQIGRASCRERVWQSVLNTVGAVTLKNKIYIIFLLRYF